MREYAYRSISYKKIYQPENREKEKVNTNTFYLNVVENIEARVLPNGSEADGKGGV